MAVGKQSGTVIIINDCDFLAKYKNKLKLLEQKHFEIRHLAWHIFLLW